MPKYRSNITAVLKAQGRTNAWFWRQMGVSEALFYAIERGDRNPTPKYRKRATQILMLPEAALFLAEDLSSESNTLSPEVIPA